MNDPVISILLAVLLFAFAAYRIFMLVKQVRRSAVSHAWPVVQAEVLHKEVDIHRGYKGYLTITPQVTCKYTLQGKEYNQVFKMAGSWNKQSAKAALDEIGSEMEVRYNPQDPSELTHGYDRPAPMDYFVILLALGSAITLVILQLAK